MLASLFNHEDEYLAQLIGYTYSCQVVNSGNVLPTYKVEEIQ